ncbi:lipopolysaccharide biosynthesis protein [Marinomonas sp. ef1]|uniref:lipopolysaccharide biosynthesis protein n=1 Tax=Marinomonas sp. ef1 TaxID=2005043 RepID=UPI0012FD208C|nr:oligosaccharide flippase family protein [Marinomonas sp. ef1]
MNKDFLIVLFGRLTVAFCSLLSLRIMTTVLTPENYGELSLLLSIQGFCGLLLVNPIGQYININTHRWYDEKTLFCRIRVYRCYLIIVASTGSLLVIVSLFDTVSNLIFACLSLFLIVLMGSWNITFMDLLNMLGDRRSAILWSIVTVCSGTSFSTVFVVIDSNATNWLFGQGIGMAVGALGAKYSLRSFRSKKLENKNIILISRSEVLSYCFPLALATGLMWLSQGGYRFVIEHFWGLSALAYFAIALQVSTAIWAIIQSIIMQFLYPYFYRSVSEGATEETIKNSYSDLLNLLIPIYILAAAFFIVAAPYLLVLLIDEKYHSALVFLILGAVIQFFNVVSNVFSNAAHVRRKTSSLILPYVVSAVLTISGISVLGILNYPITYAAHMLVFSSASMLLIMAFTMNHIIAYQLKLQRLLIMTFVFIIIVFIGSFMPKKLDLIHSVLALMSLSLTALFLLMIFLIKDSSLKRLISNKLVKDDLLL